MGYRGQPISPAMDRSSQDGLSLQERISAENNVEKNFRKLGSTAEFCLDQSLSNKISPPEKYKVEGLQNIVPKKNMFGNYPVPQMVPMDLNILRFQG